ncbi:MULTISPECIES: hypothetical protein [Vibrio]|uniref:Uncharacterized protein n=2 Tax=Vibrio TaxID=662 RepID=A0A2N7NFH5_9VIBR|nr:hypothetical protein [Vibrio tasmaniensis]PMP11905.1 hypothetical protein BCS92_19365 [Vibrio tasmaniensis]TKG28874.1 hypothetical protein FC057_20440 [Vibrio tasmaniensis]TKG38872.1 hypothetical protein FC060_24945 [Vibrio tasmaniensis]TKG40899.1 hypothetical protein FC061_24115 [Vibrio tasmaniensis]TKG41107.1 hypothetical protein FC063_08475 [Vibrio tasmaniensis]
MNDINELNKDHLEEFFDVKLKNYKCPCCQTTEKPAIPTTKGEEISFSLLDLVEVSPDQSRTKRLLSTPTIPLVCQNCGNIHRIATYIVLKYFSDKGVS